MSKEGIQAIKRKGGTRYKAYVEAPAIGGKRNQLTKTFGTEAEAVKWRLATLHEIQSGQWIEETGYDLKTVFELFVNARVLAGTVAEHTIANQRSAMRSQFAPLLDLPLKAIRPELIEGCLAKGRRRGLSGATLNKSFRILRATFRWAVNEREMLLHDPTSKIRSPQIDTTEKQGWDLEQIEQFLESSYGTREFPLWATLIGAGLRRGEAQALRWQDILFAEHAIRVEVTMTRRYDEHGSARKVMGATAKTPAAKRLVPMMRDLEEILRRHKLAMKQEALSLGIGWSEERHVFPDDSGLGFITDTVLDARFKRAIAKSGVPPLTPHGLRHTFGSRAVGEGVPLTIVMRWMGHTTMEVAKRYQHPNRSEETREMTRLGGSLRLIPTAAEKAREAGNDE